MEQNQIVEQIAPSVPPQYPGESKNDSIGHSAVPNTHRSSRLILLDTARVLAIIFMIQGHTLDVLLAPAYRQGTIFNGWLFLRGLTAPMFFILSGTSFTVASLRHWNSYTQFSPKLFRRIGRYVFFVVLGYVMHWPVKTFANFKYLDAAGWQGWFQLDVLQCVGITLIFLQVLILLAKTPKRFAGFAIGLCATVVLFTPISWGINWAAHAPLSLASLMNARTGSLFPLFPWSGYILFGAALGYAYTHEWLGSGSFAKWAAIGGGLMAVAGLCASALPVTFNSQSEFWLTSPNLFLMRAGCVCILLAVLAIATRKARLPTQTLSLLARESLTIYLVHICILYGSNWNDGLRQTIGANLTPLRCLQWICALVITLLPLAWAWSWYKRREPMSLRWVRSTAFVLGVFYLIR